MLGKAVGFVAKTLAVAAVSRAAKPQPELKVTGGKPVEYQSENGDQVVARYFSLADGSLNLVKLTLPDGREHTLPQVVSTTGSRYTDEGELAWQLQGDDAFAETRDSTGAWRIAHKCKRTARRKLR
jgi:membrane-bound inhibitor of C-type lysozyme